MNGSIFFASLGDTKAVGSKLRISPAMRVVKPDESKWVIGPMPDRPLTMPSQLLARSLASGVTAPMPVMTTRRWLIEGSLLCSGSDSWGRRTAARAGCAWRQTRTGPHAAAPVVVRFRGPEPGPRSRRASALDVRLDVVDRLLDGGDLLGLFVRDLALEL